MLVLVDEFWVFSFFGGLMVWYVLLVWVFLGFLLVLYVLMGMVVY